MGNKNKISSQPPFLLVVGGTGVRFLGKKQDNQYPAVEAGPARRFSDSASGGGAAIRVVIWDAGDGKWGFGVLKETWAQGNSMKNDPDTFLLWQCAEYSTREMAKSVLGFYKDKTRTHIQKDLLERKNRLYPKQEVAWGGRSGLTDEPLPFERPPLEIYNGKEPGGLPKLRK